MRLISVLTSIVVSVAVAPPLFSQDQQSDKLVQSLEENNALLKRQVATLEERVAELKKENTSLKEELEKATTGGDKVPDDVLGIGTKLVGTNRYSMIVNDKKVVESSDMEVDITKRSGKDFTAEFWSNKRRSGVEVQGTIVGGTVKFKVTKTLTDDMPFRGHADISNG